MAHETTHDARGAETTLARAGRDERIGPTLPLLGFEPSGSHHFSAAHPTGRGDASHPGGSVDEHRAAATLALRTAPVLRNVNAQVVSQRAEQGSAVIGHLDLCSVDDESDELHHLVGLVDLVGLGAGALADDDDSR